MSELLAKLGGRGDVLVHLDFETYYAKDFSLRNKDMTSERYVRDPRFEVIGVGVKWGDRPTVWLEHWEFAEWAARVNWSRVAVNAHHSQFDGLILSHVYGIKPGFWYDTMSMARALHGPSGVALDLLAKKYGIGEKSEGLADAKGKRRADFTQAQWLAFGEYCKNDVELTAKLEALMTPRLPVEELWLIDTTIRMFTEPTFVADVPLLETTLAEERKRKREMLLKIAPTYERALEQLGSADKFAELLRAQGVEPPLKLNNKGEEIYAFAQTDSGMKALLEDERDGVRLLAEARLEAKSNIVETRVERLLGCAHRGAVPFYLKYCGAHTNRWSGGDKMNPQNFNRGGALRDAILAPAEMYYGSHSNAEAPF